MALIRYNVTEGPRDEIMAELDRYGSDRAQQGKPEKAQEFAAAMRNLELGEDTVRVGHTEYRVTGG